MVPINVCVAAREAEYVRRLADYVRQSHYGREWRVTGFSTVGALGQYLKSGYPADLLLAAPEFAAEAEAYRDRVPMALLVKRSGEAGGGDGLPEVLQYQPMPKLMRTLAAIRAESRMHQPAGSGGRDGNLPFIATVYSPSGGSGVSTTALCLAQLSARSGANSFYLDLDPFGGATGGRAAGEGLPAMLYALQSRPAEAAAAFERLRMHDAKLGIDRFPGGCPPEEKLALGADAAAGLLQAAAASPDYDAVFVDLGSSPGEAHLEMFARSAVIFWLTPDHPSGQHKTEAALGFFRRRWPDRFNDVEPRICHVAARTGQSGLSGSAAGLRFACRLPDVPQLRHAGPEAAAASPVLQSACLGLLNAAGWKPEGGVRDDRRTRSTHAAGACPQPAQYG